MLPLFLLIEDSVLSKTLSQEPSSRYTRFPNLVGGHQRLQQFDSLEKADDYQVDRLCR